LLKVGTGMSAAARPSVGEPSTNAATAPVIHNNRQTCLEIVKATTPASEMP
jgi:hypothetical protein